MVVVQLVSVSHDIDTGGIIKRTTGSVMSVPDEKMFQFRKRVFTNLTNFVGLIEPQFGMDWSSVCPDAITRILSNIQFNPKVQCALTWCEVKWKWTDE